MTTQAPQQCTTNQIVLTKGPSVDRILDAFKYAYDKENGMHVVFVDDDGHEIRVQVQQLAHENGSGQSLMFAGHLVWTTMNLPFEASYVSGYWHGQSRRGFIYLSNQHMALGQSNR